MFFVFFHSKMNYSVLWIFVLFFATFAESAVTRKDFDPAIEIETIESTLQDKTMEILRDISNQFKSNILKINPNKNRPFPHNGEQPPNLFQNQNPNSGNPFAQQNILRQPNLQQDMPQGIASNMSPQQRPGFPLQQNFPGNSAHQMFPKSKLEQMLNDHLSPEQIVLELSRGQQFQIPNSQQQSGPNIPLPPPKSQGMHLKSKLEQMLDAAHLSPEQIVSELSRGQQSQIPNSPQQPRPSMPLRTSQLQDVHQKSKLKQMLDAHLSPEQIVSELSRGQQFQIPNSLQRPGPNVPLPPPQSQGMHLKSKLEQMLDAHLNPEQIVSELSRDQQSQILNSSQQPGPNIPLPPSQSQDVHQKSKLEQMLDAHLSPEQIVSELSRGQQSQISNSPQQPGPSIPLSPSQSQDVHQKSKLEQMLDAHLSPEQIVSELFRGQQFQIPNSPQQPGPNIPLPPLQSQGMHRKSKLEQMLDNHLSPEQIVSELSRDQELQIPKFQQQQGHNFNGQNEPLFPLPSGPHFQPNEGTPPQTPPIGIPIISNLEHMLAQGLDPQKIMSELVREKQKDFQKFQPAGLPGLPQSTSQQHLIKEIQIKLAQMIEQPRLTPEHHSKLQDIHSHLSQILQHPFRKSQDPSKFGQGLEQLLSKLPETISELSEMVLNSNKLPHPGLLSLLSDDNHQKPSIMTNPPEIMRQQQSLLQGIQSKLSQLFQHNLEPSDDPFQNLPPFPILSLVEPVEFVSRDNSDSKQQEGLHALHRQIQKDEAKLRRQHMKKMEHNHKWLSPQESQAKQKTHKNLPVEDSSEYN